MRPTQGGKAVEASDQLLVLRAQNGQMEAFEELIRKYERRALTLAFRLTGNQDDASDALQDALIKVYTHIHSYRGQGPFAAWLFRVTAHACMDLLRRRQRRAWNLVPDATAWDVFQAPGITPEESALRQEDRETVRAALGRLPEEHRAVLVLKDLMGCSYVETALVLRCPLNTVKSKVHRARKYLGRDQVLARMSSTA